jgi:hypothetical protein
VPVPNAVLPSLKVTVPVATEGATVAVNVSMDPDTVGLAEELNATDALAGFTDCVSVEEVLGLSLLSPP